MTGKPGPASLRVVVVDDSPTVREMVAALLQAAEGIQVAGVGASGEEAVRLVKRLNPDALAMDVRMAGMDGLEATRQIMREAPLPIILMTSTVMAEDTDLTFRAIKAGALTVVRKPTLADPETCANLVQTVRLMAGLPVVHHWGRRGRREALPTAATAATAATAPLKGILPDQDLFARLQVIGIASSTGGPGTLATILGELSADFPWPILIVQHVTPGFGQGMAEWLNTQTPLHVRLARQDDTPQPGSVLIAPDGYHLQISQSGTIELSKGEAYRGMRPSANYLFSSLAQHSGPRAMGIILTGMGDDGVDGLQKMYQAGSFTIAQDEESCVVYGMPREAVLAGIVSQVLAPKAIAALLKAGTRQPQGEIRNG